MSFPVPPSKVSLPSPPWISSAPPKPSSESLFFEPINKSSPLPTDAVIPSVVLSATEKYIFCSEVVISPEENPSLSVYETLTLIFLPWSAETIVYVELVPTSLQLVVLSEVSQL